MSPSGEYPKQPDKRSLEHRLFEILEKRTGTLTPEDLEVLVEVVTKGRIEGVYHFDIERAWDKLKEELNQYLKKSVEEVKSYLIRIIEEGEYPLTLEATKIILNNKVLKRQLTSKEFVSIIEKIFARISSQELNLIEEVVNLLLTKQPTKDDLISIIRTLDVTVPDEKVGEKYEEIRERLSLELLKNQSFKQALTKEDLLLIIEKVRLRPSVHEECIKILLENEDLKYQITKEEWIKILKAIWIIELKELILKTIIEDSKLKDKFTTLELVLLAENADGLRDKVWEEFVASNPTKDDLLFIIKNKGYFGRKAISLFLETSVEETDKDIIISIITHYRPDEIDEALKEKIARRFLELKITKEDRDLFSIIFYFIEGIKNDELIKEIWRKFLELELDYSERLTLFTVMRKLDLLKNEAFDILEKIWDKDGVSIDNRMQDLVAIIHEVPELVKRAERKLLQIFQQIVQERDHLEYRELDYLIWLAINAEFVKQEAEEKLNNYIEALKNRQLTPDEKEIIRRWETKLYRAKINEELRKKLKELLSKAS
jgi:hypothetical protein